MKRIALPAGLLLVVMLACFAMLRARAQDEFAKPTLLLDPPVPTLPNPILPPIADAIEPALTTFPSLIDAQPIDQPSLDALPLPELPDPVLVPSFNEPAPFNAPNLKPPQGTAPQLRPGIDLAPPQVPSRRSGIPIPATDRLSPQPMDDSLSRSLQIFPLKYMPAHDGVSTLQQLFPDRNLNFVADERTNSIIVRGHGEDFEEITELLMQLDSADAVEPKKAVIKRRRSDHELLLEKRVLELKSKLDEETAEPGTQKTKGADTRLQELPQQIRSAVDESFNERQRQQLAEIEELTARLNKLAKAVREREAKREAIIEERLSQLIGGRQSGLRELPVVGSEETPVNGMIDDKSALRVLVKESERQDFSSDKEGMAASKHHPEDAYDIMPLENAARIAVRVGSGKILRHSEGVRQVLGFDKDLVSVQTGRTANDITVFGLKPGVTDINWIDEHGQRFSNEIDVTGDTRKLETLIRRAFPEEEIFFDEVSKSAIRLSGSVSSAGVFSRIEEIASQFYPDVLNHLEVQNATIVDGSINVAVGDATIVGNAHALRKSIARTLEEIDSLQQKRGSFEAISGTPMDAHTALRNDLTRATLSLQQQREECGTYHQLLEIEYQAAKAKQERSKQELTRVQLLAETGVVPKQEVFAATAVHAEADAETQRLGVLLNLFADIERSAIPEVPEAPAAETKPDDVAPDLKPDLPRN